MIDYLQFISATVLETGDISPVVPPFLDTRFVFITSVILIVADRWETEKSDQLEPLEVVTLME